MRIALCGSHGVGKTTLAKIVAEEYGLPILHDIVVDAYKLGLPINENTTTETQMRLAAKQFEQERTIVSFVADKCIFDYFIYAEVLHLDPDVVASIKKMALDSYQYDAIFYIKPEFPIPHDGVRSTNVQFQAEVDDLYLGFLEENAIPYHLLTWSIQERKEQILSFIESMPWQKHPKTSL
jgi:nicotinamide riboside kinase